MLDTQAILVIVTFLLVATITIFGFLFFHIVGKKTIHDCEIVYRDKGQVEPLIDRLNSLDVSSLKLAKFAEGCIEIAKYKKYSNEDIENTFTEDYEFGRAFYYKSDYLEKHGFLVDSNMVANLEDEFFENYRKLCELRSVYSVYSGAKLALPVLTELHKTKTRMENFLLSLHRKDYSKDSDELLINVIKNNFLTPCGV